MQYDPPSEPREYVHRVGRTARAGQAGRAILFLLPEEKEFLRHLLEAGAALTQFEFPAGKVAQLQERFEKIIESNYHLHEAAREAFRSHLLAYASNTMKTVFNVRELDLVALAQSMGFRDPPRVNLPDIGVKIRKRKAESVAVAKAARKERAERRRFAEFAEGLGEEVAAAHGGRPDYDEDFVRTHKPRPDDDKAKRSSTAKVEEEEEEEEEVRAPAPRAKKAKKQKKK